MESQTSPFEGPPSSQVSDLWISLRFPLLFSQLSLLQVCSGTALPSSHPLGLRIHAECAPGVIYISRLHTADR